MIRWRTILGDPGADSGDEENSKRAGKYMARRKVKNGEKSPWGQWLFTIYKKIPEILVGKFRSIRTVRIVYHLTKISGLSHRTRLDSSYNMKMVRNSRNL